MTTPQVTEALAKITTQVKEMVSKTELSAAESKDRMDKFEDGLKKVMDTLKDETIRKTVVHSGSGDYQSAGDFLAKSRGCKTPQDFSKVKAYATNHLGQTTDTLTVPGDVKDALQTADEVVFCDYMMKRLHGAAWEFEKQEKGERQAFKDHFPEMFERHDATWRALMLANGKEKATLDIATTGEGLEWVPTTFSTTLFDQIRLAMPVVNLIPHFPMPRSPWVYPLLTGVGRAYRKLELTNAPESTLTTDNRTWTAHVMSVYMAYSDEIDEDSIVAIAPTVRSSIIRAMGEGLDRALVNGANQTTHFDTDYVYASGSFETYQRGMDGLRHFALDPGTGTASTQSGAGNAISFQDIGDALVKMLKFGAGRVGAGEVAHLVDPRQWLRLLTEASSPVVTLDKYGSGATILNGELGRIFGIPSFISQGIDERNTDGGGVGTTGVNETTTANNILSTTVLFNRTNFRIGDLRRFRFETDKDIIAGRNDIVATGRWAFESIEGETGAAGWDPSATPAVVAIVNITS